jgi:hypothetical protein
MKIKAASVIVVLMGPLAIILVTTSCSMVADCLTSHEPWNFVEAVGGIRIGDPQPVSPGVWTLPVECDVSSLTEVTTKPTTLNSARVVKNVEQDVKQDCILIWVVTRLANEKYKDSHWTNGITVRGIRQGIYKLVYLNPDGSTVDLRSIEFRR